VPAPSAETPKIDLSRIDFPSDRITVKALRAARPGSGFDDKVAVYPEGKNAFDEFVACLSTERELAGKAFDAALQGHDLKRIGKGDHKPAWDRQEIVSALDSEYRAYGLSSGRQQSIQLIRQIEAQAVAQAEEHLGRGR
jgi:hypothetical protein